MLRAAVHNQVGPWSEIKFVGWPKLEIYLRGKEFNSSVTPPLMRGLIEFQKGIYQSYAAAKYGNPTKRLSDEEKKALEIIVKVEGGSSGIEIDFQALAVELIKQIGGKMDTTHVLISVLTFLVLYFGTSAFRSYLEHRKEVRLREVSDETQRKTLEVLQFQTAQETERTKILAEAIGPRPQLQNVQAIAHDSQTELVRGMGEASEARIAGIPLTGRAALTLVQNARRESEEIRLDGTYRLVKLDWSDASRFRVKVWNVDTGLELDAVVQDDTLTGAYKTILQQAEWSRAPVKLQINAKRFGEDEYRSAVILKVEEVSPEDPAVAAMKSV